MKEMWFEDLSIGMTFDSQGRTITEAAVESFAGVSGDFHPLHTNAVYATQTLFGQRVAHGALILSIAIGLRTNLPFTGRALMAFAEILTWKFHAPVFIGDTVRVCTTISDLRLTSQGDMGVVTQQVEVTNQHDEIVQEGDMINLIRVRSV